VTGPKPGDDRVLDFDYCTNVSAIHHLAPVDDIVVRINTSAPAAAIHVGSDTGATIVRRRGGSAANVAAIAGRLTGAARFLGQVGDDAIADALLAELTADGVDVSCVRRHGRTGAIVVLVETLWLHGTTTRQWIQSLIVGPFTAIWFFGAALFAMDKSKSGEQICS